MFKIIKKKRLNEAVTLMDVEAPLIAKKAKAGQFIIFRIDDMGERIPLTISDVDTEKGTVTIIFQKVGLSTMLLDEINEGEYISDFVGPLGMPTELEGYKNVAVIGGGVGCAIAFPQAKALYKMGANVDIIAGFRNKDIIILEEEMRKVSANLYITTDDGSYGYKGFVSQKLKDLIDSGREYDLVIAIGPVPMMKAVTDTTRDYGLKTLVSLNPIMIDGTGMCGCCRVTVDGTVKFACIDGPDFDGHKVDFKELINRNSNYREIENKKVKNHKCRVESLGKSLIK